MFRALSTSIGGMLLRACKVYVRPILEYGTSVFSPYKSIQMLCAVQNSFLRKLLKREWGCVTIKYPVVAKEFHDFGMKTLGYKRNRNDMLLFRTIVHHNSGIKMTDIKTMRTADSKCVCVSDMILADQTSVVGSISYQVEHIMYTTSFEKVRYPRTSLLLESF